MEYTTTAAAQAAYVSNCSTSASGGNISTNNGMRIHTFTSNGTFSPGGIIDCDIVVVGGGGGGGSDVGGGGGGGRVLYVGNLTITAGQSVTIGNGGSGGYGPEGGGTSFGITGQSSLFGSYTAMGGCGGGGRGATQGGRTDGWSGGGGGYNSPHSVGNGGGSGGAANNSQNGGGGGGSAPAAGGAGTGANGGTGGNGMLVASGFFWDNSAYYGGGGGGSGLTGAAGSGGAGGGGAGTASSANGNPGSANSGGGGGGAGSSATNWGGSGGSGIVIVKYSTTPQVGNFSESSIKTQGSYAMKVIVSSGTSLNKTLTRTVSPTINLTDRTQIKFDIRSNRTGSNIKIGIRDSGGTTTYITPNITSADVFQTVTWDISAVPNTNKDAIDRIIIEIVNAAAPNTFYIDNLFAPSVAPNSPTLNRAASLSPTSIEWGWQDNSSGASQEDEFRIYSSTGGLIATRTADTTYWLETGLAKNKEYSRYIQAYNTAGSSNSPTATWRTKPGAYQSKTSQGEPARTGPASDGFSGDASWTWEITTRAGAPLTITAYIRYNGEYGGSATKPKLTLTGRGISPTSISATGAAQDAWEQLTLNPGAPTQNATLTLRAEGFSTTPGAKFYIDDITVNQ